MALKTLVKVSEVNNLSDARYCAGMGVEMIGFALDENHPKFIELAKLREISVWISGVKVVGEFIGDNADNINYLTEQLNLDYVQVNHLMKPEQIQKLKAPTILRLNFSANELDELVRYLDLYKKYVSYFLLENEHNTTLAGQTGTLQTLCSKYPIILGFGIENGNIDTILKEIKPAGIGLRGGDEIKPGLKNFDALSDILETLEMTD